MFKLKILLYIACFLHIILLQVSAQQAYTLVGNLAVNAGQTYSYKLQFTDSGDIIKGYSITDIGGPDQTKSAITGTINTDKKELTFRETNITNTKSAIARDSFCYVHAHLKLAGLKKGKALKGSFTGYRPGGKAQCAKGSITLYSASDILDKLMKLNPSADSLLKPVKEKLTGYDTIPARVIAVTPGNAFNAYYDTPTASMEIWDDQHIDGDIISVKHNGRIILDKYVLTSGHKRIHIKLSGVATDSIALIAVSEGSEPSNTAMLKLTSGKNVTYLKASSKLNEPVYIILKAKDR